MICPTEFVSLRPPAKILITRMEGGMMPWRVNKIEINSPDLDSYGKPLPPPPPGYFWEKNADNSWSLAHITVEQTPFELTVLTSPSVIEHIVLAGDTIQGICLRYRIKAIDLRRHNLFSGNNIQFKKTLRIPIEPGVPVMLQYHDSEEVKVQIFRNVTHESVTEARIYLEEHNWDVEKAITAWKQDDAWAVSHAKVVAPACIVTSSATVVGPDVPVNVAFSSSEFDVELVNYHGYSNDLLPEPSLQPLLS